MAASRGYKILSIIKKTPFPAVALCTGPGGGARWARPVKYEQRLTFLGCQSGVLSALTEIIIAYAP
jgi:hypothetical protein